MYVIIEPGQALAPTFIDAPLPKYEEVQKLLADKNEDSVFIEAAYGQFKNKNIVILCDEDGFSKRKPFCFATKDYQYFGIVIICNFKNKSKFTDLTKAQIKELKNYWASIKP